MKNDIQKAYEKAGPDLAVQARIYERIMKSAPAARTSSRRNPLSRRVLIAAAVIAALVLLATGGYAAYEHWRLPKPEPYAPGNAGIYQEQERNDYTVADTDPVHLTIPSGTQGTAPDMTTPSMPEQISDEDFIRKGLSLLNQVGLLDVRPEELTVVRQENLYWGREEAEIQFRQGDHFTSVKFNAETGRFLGLSGIDWQMDGSAACETEAEARALATRYYEALPVEQGYEIAHLEQYDDQFWSFDFCREVEPGIFNPYEAVRVAINPVSGRLTGCTVFYVPLLDDHEPGQEPITQEQAVEIVRSSPKLRLDGMTLKEAKTEIVLPNWQYSEFEFVPDHQASKVSRWAWVLTWERSESEFPDLLKVCVDCYTGEILGGDATK